MFQNDSKEKCRVCIKLGSNEGELQPTGGGVLGLQFVEELVVEWQHFMRKITL